MLTQEQIDTIPRRAPAPRPTPLIPLIILAGVLLLIVLGCGVLAYAVLAA